MDAITIFPENKEQEKTLQSMLKLMRLHFEKYNPKRMQERLEELEDMLDKAHIEAARKEPTRPWVEIRAELDKKYNFNEAE